MNGEETGGGEFGGEKSFGAEGPGCDSVSGRVVAGSGLWGPGGGGGELGVGVEEVPAG